jgi:hypothetical protein
MRQGAMMFAFNNQKLDYVKLAAWNAHNIKQFLGLPTTLVTDQPIENSIFDQVIVVERPAAGTRYFEDVGSTVSWYNGNRVDALDLSPYDRTLLLDADYVVGSNLLDSWMNVDQEFMCYKKAFDITGRTPMTDLQTFGTHQFPMWWATVMMFDKTNTSRYIFDSMRMVRDNWQHYRNLYKIAQTNFRNDYALSIALGLLSGHTIKIKSSVSSMPTAMPDVKITRADDAYQFDFVRDNKNVWVRLKNLDFHAMGKKHLERLIAQDNG